MELSFGESLAFSGGSNETAAGTWTSAAGNVEPFLIRGNVVLAVTSYGADAVNGPSVLVSTLTFEVATTAPSPARLALLPFIGTTGTVFIRQTTAYETALQSASVVIRTSTPTRTPQATWRATPTATALRSPPMLCPCDCNEDGSVFVNEVILAVDIALTGEDVSPCRAADRNRDGLVTVDELVAGVRAGLVGC